MSIFRSGLIPFYHYAQVINFIYFINAIKCQDVRVKFQSNNKALSGFFLIASRPVTVSIYQAGALRQGLQW